MLALFLPRTSRVDNRYPSYQPGISQHCWLTRRTSLGAYRYSSYQPGVVTWENVGRKIILQSGGESPRTIRTTVGAYRYSSYQPGNLTWEKVDS